jgi:hypothetical protein
MGKKNLKCILGPWKAPTHLSNYHLPPISPHFITNVATNKKNSNPQIHWLIKHDRTHPFTSSSWEKIRRNRKCKFDLFCQRTSTSQCYQVLWVPLIMGFVNIWKESVVVLKIVFTVIKKISIPPRICTNCRKHITKILLHKYYH